MIVGTGVDLAEVPRIRATIESYGARFIGRVYTPAEIAYVERKANRFERYAARFAAKEAGMKAIGTGWRHGVRGRISKWPTCRRASLLCDSTEWRRKSRRGWRAQLSLSMTHTAELGMAHVILED